MKSTRMIRHENCACPVHFRFVVTFPPGVFFPIPFDWNRPAGLGDFPPRVRVFSTFWLSEDLIEKLGNMSSYFSSKGM